MYGNDGPRPFREGLLEGKVALVTGGDSGIARGVCTVLSRLGAEVILTGSHVTGLDSWFRELSSEGGPVSGFESDTTNPETIRELVEEIETIQGRLDLLVTFAKPVPSRPALDLDLADWQHSVESALSGTFSYCRALYALLAKARGTIVNLVDSAGGTSFAGNVATAAGAAGVENLTRTLAAEWSGAGIRVNAIALGGIDTSAYERCAWEPTDEAGAAIPKPEVPLGRLGTPTEVGTTVAFLASDAAAYITGTTLVLDGGQSLRTLEV